jgi:hypothetical protein
MPSFLAAEHNGGKVMVGSDNNIYLTLGEIGRNWTNTKAQKQVTFG